MMYMSFWLSRVFSYLNLKKTSIFNDFSSIFFIFLTFSAYFDVIYYVIGDDVGDEITNYGIYTYWIMVNIYKHFISQLLIFIEKSGPNRPKNVPSPFRNLSKIVVWWIIKKIYIGSASTQTKKLTKIWLPIIDDNCIKVTICLKMRINY